MLGKMMFESGGAGFYLNKKERSCGSSLFFITLYREVLTLLDDVRDSLHGTSRNKPHAFFHIMKRFGSDGFSTTC